MVEARCLHLDGRPSVRYGWFGYITDYKAGEGILEINGSGAGSKHSQTLPIPQGADSGDVGG